MASDTRPMQSKLQTIFLLFCLFAASVQAASAVIGVDFGTEYIKATLVKPGIPLEIVLTKDSRRKELSAVAFKPTRDSTDPFPERIYGSDAIALSARFPGDVYPNLKALLGLPASNSKVQEYAARHPALKLEAEKTKGTAAFRSSAFSADEEPWLVEEILAMELKSIQRNAEALAGKGSSVKDVVITVPPFFGAEEKRAITLAAELAGLRVLSLLSDGLAVGLNYATSRTFPSINEGGKPEHHLVFDMGAGSTKATVLRFQGRTVKDVGKFNKTIQEVQVLGTGWDRTLGGDALNSLIVDDMIASFVDSKAAKAASVKAESVQSHGRAAAKLWKEAERLRHVLSANMEAQASFEGLYEDVDFKYKLNRADFEQLAASFAEKVFPAIETACDRAHVEIADLDSVILHGGAVRTPFIQKQLEKIIGNADKIRSNVNADEAAVFGAGFRGAGLSPSFRVKEIRPIEAAGYPVGMKWTNIHKKPQHQVLFPPQSAIGIEKTVTFMNQEDMPIEFYQHIPGGENVSPGNSEKPLVVLTTKNLTSSVAELKGKGCTDGQIRLKLSVRLNADNAEVEITKNVLQCEYEEEEKKDSVVDSVKGLFGFGSKKEGQEILEDESVPVEDVETETTSTKTKSKSKSKSKSTSTGSTESASTSAAATDGKPKLVKRLHIIPIAYELEIQGYPTLPPSEILRMKERLSAFDDSDKSRRQREESLNQLEAFSYKVRDMVDDSAFMAVATEAERVAIQEKGMFVSEWLYGDGADATRAELKAMLKELKDLVNPVKVRKEELATRPEQIQFLRDALNSTARFIENVKGQLEEAAKSSSAAEAESDSASSTTPVPSSSTTSFDGLEDDATSTFEPVETTTTPNRLPQYTPPPAEYDPLDLAAVEQAYNEVKEWFEAKLVEQEKLADDQDPVLFVKDMQTMAEKMQKNTMEMLVNGLKQKDAKAKANSASSTTKSKSKTTKSKKAKATKGTKSGKGKNEDNVPTGEFNGDLPEGFDHIPTFKMSENGEMPSEEELEAFFKKIQEDNGNAGSEESYKGEEEKNAGEHKIDEL